MARRLPISGGAAGDRENTLWTVAFVILLFTITITGLRSADSAHEMRGFYGRMAEVQHQQDSLLEGHSRLMLERSALSSMQNIEKVAESELGMQFPDQVGQVLR